MRSLTYANEDFLCVSYRIHLLSGSSAGAPSGVDRLLHLRSPVPLLSLLRSIFRGKDSNGEDQGDDGVWTAAHDRDPLTK